MEINDTQTPEEGGSEEKSSTVGQMLKVAREERELSIEQIAGELRIESRFLIALEEDNFEAFSAPVFTKGFIKQYGQRLGLEYGDLLVEYYRQVDVPDIPVVHSKPIRLRDEQQITQWIISGSVLALLVGGFAIWYLSTDEAPAVVTPIEEPAEPAVGDAGAVPQALPLPVAEVVEVVETDENGETNEAVETDETGETNEAVVSPVATSSVVAPEEAPAEPRVASVAPAEFDALSQPEMPTVEVTISFEQDCWTEVTDARGQRLFYGLGSTGAVSSFEAPLPLAFFLGNAGGVRLLLNGRPYPIPADSRQGNLARFVIAEGL